MRIDGLTLSEGSTIKNLSVDTGTVFPSLPNSGEMFYRTDGGNLGLYVYNGSSWAGIAAGVAVGSVTSVSVTTANGVSGSVVNATTTPAISIALGAITPSSINTAGSVTASSFIGSGASLTGITSAAALTTPRTISTTGDGVMSVSFDGSANVSSGLVFATVNSSPQTDAFRKVTVNGKGLVTASSAVVAGDITTALGYNPVNKAGDTLTGALILSADPTAALGAVTKQYVDNISTGLNAHPAVATATTAALPACTSANGTAGVGATLTGNVAGALGTVGGYASLVAGNRLLVKNQATQAHNGLYVVSFIGDGGTQFVLTRAPEFDNTPDGEIAAGDFVYVQNGTLAGTQWVQTTAGTLTVGTSPIVFSQLSGAGVVTGGTGISVASNVVTNTGVVSLVAGTNIAISGSTGNVTVNVSGTVPSAVTAGTVTTAAQPAITSVGTLSSLAVTGAVTAASFTGAHNGTVGSTTPNTGAFTTLSASGAFTSTNATGGLLLTDTPDGADSKYVAMCGGGGLSAGRGAYVITYGNENAVGGNNGDLVLSSGNAAGSSVKVAAGLGIITTVSQTGLAVTGALSATGNGDFNTGSSGRIRSGTPTFGGQLEALGGGSGAIISITPNTISGANGVDYTTSFVSGGNGPHNFKIGSTTHAVVSSTGLAVTGALSSTTNTEVGLSLAVSSGTDAKLQQWTNAGGTYTIGVDRNTGGYFGSAYSFGINAPTGKSIRHLINSSVITETTSTGLAVTGALSAGRTGIPLHFKDNGGTDYGNDIYIPHDGGSSTQKAFRIRSSYNGGSGQLRIDRSTNSTTQFTDPSTLTYATAIALDATGLAVTGGISCIPSGGGRVFSTAAGSTKVKLASFDAGWASTYGFEAASSSLSLSQFGAYGGTKDTSDYSFVAAQGQDYNTPTLKVFPSAVTVTGALSATTGVTNTATTANSSFRATSTNGTTYFGTDSSTGGDFGTSAYATIIYRPASTECVFVAGGVRQATIDASGNLGLGVTPSAWVSTAKAIHLSTLAAVGHRNGTSDLILSWNASVTSGTNSGTGYVYRSSGDRASAYEQNGEHRWYTATAGTAGNPISFTEAMTLDANGVLSINGGASWAPAQNGISLSVSGNDKFVTSYYDASSVTIGAGISTKTGIQIFGQTHASGNKIVHRVGNTDAMTLSSTGLSVTGAVTAASFTGALTGNASTATTLATARTINGVSFNGSANITVTAAAGTLTGATLAAGVTASSLTSVGTLSSLAVTGAVTGASFTGALSGAHNGTVGATTPSTGVFTTLSATGNLTATSITPSSQTLTDGATISWNCSLGQNATVTLAGNRTVAAPTNQTASTFYMLEVIQDATGSRTLAWNSIFKFANATAPTLSTTPLAHDYFCFESDGTNMREVGRSQGVI